jgi:hypothetical protein
MYSLHMGNMSGHSILVSKPYGKTPARVPSCSWEGNVKTFVTKLGSEGIDWIHLVHIRPF